MYVQPLEVVLTRKDAGDVPLNAAPSDLEQRHAAHMMSFLRQQPFSPYWPKEDTSNSDNGKLARYTDRYQPDHGSSASQASLLQLAMLHMEAMPPHLWNAYTRNSKKRNARLKRASSDRRVANIDWDNLHLEEKKTGDGEEEAPADSDEEDWGDYEDEDDDDYAQNYFDNGEDDDDDGGGGGDDGAGDEAAFD